MDKCESLSSALNISNAAGENIRVDNELSSTRGLALCNTYLLRNFSPYPRCSSSAIAK